MLQIQKEKRIIESKIKAAEFEKSYFTCLVKTIIPIIIILFLFGLILWLINPAVLPKDFWSFQPDFVNISGTYEILEMDLV